MTDKKHSMPLPLADVAIEQDFWKKAARLVREVVIPYQWEALNDRIPGAEPSHAIANFRIAAGLEQGEFKGMVFQDSDLAKWIEAVGYSLAVHPDPELEKTADGLIEVIALAQQPDGYLNTYFTLKEPDKKWTNLRECHELYCAGHMIEAAVAYYEATGKRRLLDVMCRLADLIDRRFGLEDGKLRGYPGHEELELALVKLYHATGDKKYLELSQYFINERGSKPYYFDIELQKRGGTSYWPGFDSFDISYAQAHLPVREQVSAEGHAVRAVYLFAGMADVAAETGDASLLAACRVLWDNIVSKRMYITGGIGSTSLGEAFTFDYDLPNDTVYAETCASIGLIFFAHRMLRVEPDRRYADVLERALYNTVMGGMALDGRAFFYVNPLEVLPEASEKSPLRRHVKVERQKWFGCACCPPNVARLLSSLGSYIYTSTQDTLYVHLYIGSQAKVQLGGGEVTVTQSTGYPRDGAVAFTVNAGSPRRFRLALRIPAWCGAATVSINGQPVEIGSRMSGGYALLDRLWHSGDSVRLNLEMPVVRMRANPQVRSDAGRVALQRGPLVYCLEQADNGQNLQQITLPRSSAFETAFEPGLLGGVTAAYADALRTDSSGWGDALYRADAELPAAPVRAKFIPYYAWANRGAGEMIVWVREC